MVMMFMVIGVMMWPVMNISMVLRAIYMMYLVNMRMPKFLVVMYFFV